MWRAENTDANHSLTNEIAGRGGACRESSVISGHDAVARIAPVVCPKLLLVAVDATVVRAVHEPQMRSGWLWLGETGAEAGFGRAVHAQRCAHAVVAAVQRRPLLADLVPPPLGVQAEGVSIVTKVVDIVARLPGSTFHPVGHTLANVTPVPRHPGRALSYHASVRRCARSSCVTTP